MPVKESKVYFAVIDTNVIISALLSHYSDAATSLMLDYLFKGLVIPLYNEEILSEYSNVLHRGKFKFPEELISRVLKVMTEKGISADRVSAEFDFPDPKRCRFLRGRIVERRCIFGNWQHKTFPESQLCCDTSGND